MTLPSDNNFQQTIGADDRGLAYGDGLFETIAVSNGAALCWPRHLARLQSSCRRLGINGVDWDALRGELREKVASHGQGQAVLKIIVTRGAGARGYAPPRNIQPTILLQLSAFPVWPASWATEGIRLQLCETRLAIQPRLAGMKHLNRLEQVLASQEIQGADVAEGLMLDLDDRVVCGIKSNLFLVRAGQLLTPDLSRCGVAGIARGLILEMAGGEGIDVTVRDVSGDELLLADEVFVCNALIGVRPVRHLEQRQWEVGPLTRSIQAKLYSWKIAATPDL